MYHTIRLALDNDWPLKTLLKSGFIVINDVMVSYYGVDGHEFRKVNLPKNSLRGGLMSTAAVLVMWPDGVRTSPVERRAWVLRHWINRPPPTTPNVPCGFVQFDRGWHKAPLHWTRQLSHIASSG